mgnify:CR=1
MHNRGPLHSSLVASPVVAIKIGSVGRIVPRRMGREPPVLPHYLTSGDKSAAAERMWGGSRPEI